MRAASMPRRSLIAAASLTCSCLGAGFYVLRHRLMRSSDSKSRLEQLVADSGSTVAALSAADAVRFMLTFYRDVRADDSPLEGDGDMILFQWGAYNRGEGESYTYDISRQFIVSGSDDDDGMSQLSLTVHFPVTDALRALKGNKWCCSPAQVDEFEHFIRTHAATRAVSSLIPLQVTLEWSPT